VLDGMPLHVLDTAGLRIGGDAIEAEGIRRARAAMTRADRILFVIDAAADPEATAYLEERALLPPGVPVTLVFNKMDLVAREPGVVPPGATIIRLSALTGEGFEALGAHLKSCVGFDAEGAGALSARARHLEALAQVDSYLTAAARQLTAHNAPELVAEELKRAQQALGDIVGAESSDELLGRIFARFCIGK
jgi:tRNA modification GTPase